MQGILSYHSKSERGSWNSKQITLNTHISLESKLKEIMMNDGALTAKPFLSKQDIAVTVDIVLLVEKSRAMTNAVLSMQDS